MGDNMAFFYSFTDSLKQKWLQFFQVNRDWITLHMQVESVYTPDGGKRPSSYLILGVVNALEPKLAQLMLPFAKLNPDADTLIEVLDLHFDPDMALGNSGMPKVEEYMESEGVMQGKSHDETFTIPNENSFGEEAIIHEFVMVDSHQEMLIPDEFSQMSIGKIAELPVQNGTENGFGDISFSNGQNSNQTPSIESVDDFGDISFDDLKDSDSKISAATAPEANLGQNMLDDLDTADENTFGDVMSDVWSEEKSASGEDLPSGIFDDSEIARLFPNA
jgi:Family of unknown function (DUF5331)